MSEVSWLPGRGNVSRRRFPLVSVAVAVRG